MTSKSSVARRGFTIVELLVVIGIIMVLLSFLLPVVSKVRNAATVSETLALVNVLKAGCERYQQDQRYYPGPFSNDQIETGNAKVNTSSGFDSIAGAPGNIGLASGSGGSVTMSENLLLGLLGGLVLDSGGKIKFDPVAVGSGPGVFNPVDPSMKPAYLDLRQEQLSKGFFVDDVGKSALDTNVPEFIDKFNPALPILYLRARKQAFGVISDNGKDVCVETTFDSGIKNFPVPNKGHLVDAGTSSYQGLPNYPFIGAKFQYDQSQIKPYVYYPLGGRYHNLQGLSLGDQTPPPGPAGSPPPDWSDIDGKGTTRASTLNASLISDGVMSNAPFNCLGYFKAISAISTDPRALLNAYNFPREKDRYFLISAGPDRIYGSEDDVISAGNGSP